jgi:hypothetical protein
LRVYGFKIRWLIKNLNTFEVRWKPGMLIVKEALRAWYAPFLVPKNKLIFFSFLLILSVLIYPYRVLFNFRELRELM